jgi:hypothetical protein
LLQSHWGYTRRWWTHHRESMSPRQSSLVLWN